ncbi:MAG: hypothetical protein HY903_03110 [Deltaproteobacteria bacterium]|nr:hypothetical protein [Deltaproteobacteria bacterium]
MLAFCLSFGLTAVVAGVDVADIQAQIQAQGLSWQAGKTWVTELPDEERARLMLPPGEHPLSRQVRTRVELGAEASRPVGRPAMLATLPLALDWRALAPDGYNWLPPVRNQGSCGSCWDFATVGAVEGLWGYRRATPDPVIDLSEQQLLDCAQTTFGCDSGGITWDINIPILGYRITGPGSYMKGTGLTSESCYPYTSGGTGTRGTCTDPATLSPACQAAILKSGDETPLSSTLPTDGFPWDPTSFTLTPDEMDEIKAYLQERPVGVSMRAYSDLSAYHSGVYEPTANPGGYGLHAVVLVGYNDAEGAWIVRNSWGASWGENGYFRIKYNTSLIGMYAFVYGLDEERKDPAFCPSLPVEVRVNATNTAQKSNLTIANCGSGVLHWQASVGSWIAFETDAGVAVTSGAELAAGTTYKVRAKQAVAVGTAGSITLTGAPNGPVTIAITTADAPAPDGGPRTDGGPRHDGGSLGDDDQVLAGDPRAPGDGQLRGDGADLVDDGGDPGGCACRGGGGATVLALLGPLWLVLRRSRRPVRPSG